MMGPRRECRRPCFTNFRLRITCPRTMCCGRLIALSTWMGVDAEGMMRYRASKADCDTCQIKAQCCPKEPQRKILRSIHEDARDRARDITKTGAYVTASYARKKVEMLFAHLKHILKLNRLRLRGPNGAKDEFLMAATAQNLRRLAKLVPNPA